MRHFWSNDVLLSLLITFLQFCEMSVFGKNVYEYKIPTKCMSNEYFDAELFSCVRCNVTKNLEPSVDQLTCVCNKVSKVVGFQGDFPLCVRCPLNTIVTHDRRDCIPCQNNFCSCPVNQIRMDRNPDGTLLSTMECLPCSDNTYPSPDGSKCLSCDNFAYNNDSLCNCPTVSHVRVREYCIHKNDAIGWPNEKSTYVVQFDTKIIDSYYFRSELQATFYWCKKRNKLSCEHLANMCLLALFTNEMACSFFTQKPSQISLFYEDDANLSFSQNKYISQTYSLEKDSNNSFVNFTVSSFSLKGDLQSIDTPDIFCSMLKNVRFGVHLHRKCEIRATELFNRKLQFFLPFLRSSEGGKDFLYALPVLIKNKYGKQQKPVRKFFVVDNISGYRAVSGVLNNSLRRDNDLSALRYMKSLTVKIYVKNGENRGKIYLPTLVVEYEELTRDEIVEDPLIIVDYKITFVFKESNADIYLQVSTGVFSGIALIFSGIKTWSYSRRNYRYISYVNVALWFFVYSAGIIGNMLFLIIISFCLYVFVLYKGQTVPYMLPPDDSVEENIRIYMAIAFSFKFIEILGIVYQHWNIDIFLIDWERPKNLQCQYKYDSPRTSLRKSYRNRFPNEKSPESKRPSSEIIAAKRRRISRKSHKENGRSKSSSMLKNNDTKADDLPGVYAIADNSSQDGEVNNPKNLPISIWRTYFVANEWLKLLGERRINILLQCIYVLVLLEVIGLRDWSLASPELTINNEYTEVRQNFTLQYAVFALVYISVYAVQWFTSVAFYERYIRNRKQAFVDLCPVANISVFILVFNYYGFYIHGRSVHGFADTDLLTLIHDLTKEQDDLCAHRGLIPGTVDQTFIVCTTQTFRIMYNEIFKEKDLAPSRLLRKQLNSETNWEKTCETQAKLKHFLCQFLDHCFKNEDYVIKEQYFFEKLLNIERSYPKDKSIFYIDNGLRFEQILLCGNECAIATFEITISLFSLMLCENYILACAITILLSQLLTATLKFNGKKNLINKSLLDGRFLL